MKPHSPFSRRIALSLICLVFCGLFSPFLEARAQAASQISVEKLNVQEQNDFVLEPGKIEVNLDPGATITKNIQVTNRANRKVRFNVEIEDFVGTNDEQNPITLLGDDRSPYSFKDNIASPVPEFSLNFGERASIPITIHVPADAQPGGYYTSVLVSNSLDKEETASTTSTAPKTRIISRVGVLFFIRVNGQAKESGKLDDFRVSPPGLIHEKGPFTFEVLYKNEGNVHLVPYGSIAVRNMFGGTIEQIPVNAYFALPNATRYRQIEWNKPLLIGRYTATVTLNRGYGNLTDTKTIAFWVLPWKILGGILLTVFLVLVAFYYIFSRFEFRRKK